MPGLVFLLWVWWDSGGWDSSVVRTVRGNVFHVVKVRGGLVEWQRDEYLGTAPILTGKSYFDLHVYRTEVEEPPLSERAGQVAGRRFDFPAAYEKERQTLRGERAVMTERIDLARVALWVVVAGYGMVWLGAVSAWQWRKARVMREQSSITNPPITNQSA
ncbi:hypothetical protein [Luteolibacter soli]